MSNHLDLIIEGFPQERAEELAKQPGSETLELTEKNAKEVLEKIFAADSVAVWSDLR